MREIKFRAWDKLREEFLSAGQVILAIQSGKNPKIIHYLDILYSPDTYKDRFELMQYTGLKDKNGKEIYEGDILQTNGIDGKRLWIIEYIFSGSGIGFSPESIGGGCSSVHNEVWDEEIKYSRGEIIGNRYENPELLKQEETK